MQTEDNLNALRPQDWFNIPAPVIDAFAILIQKQKDVGSKVVTIMNELRVSISDFKRRERKQKESI